MQRFAAWTNLVETTFVLPAQTTDASYALRIFTPTREIPFAGHPTIGSAHAAMETGFAHAHHGLLVQQCSAGLLPIRVEGEGNARVLFVQAPNARIVREGCDIEPMLRIALGDRPLGTLAPACVEGGRCWWLAELADEDAVRGWLPDHLAIGALARAGNNCLGLCVFARSHARDYDVVVRAFPAGVGIVEDPASAWATSREAIVVNSFSKYFSMTGWRLGWLLVPPRLLRAVDCLAGNFTVCPPALPQLAALGAFTPESYAEADAHVTRYGINRDLLLDGLTRLGITRLAPPDGAFYVYADVSHIAADSMDLTYRLLADIGLAVAPGIDFDPVDGGRWIRFSCASATSDVQEALRRLEAWLNR